MSDVFISYSRKDISFARLLHSSLNEQGFETWIDWQDIPPSTDWLNEVYQAIEEADNFVFVISESSINSEICNLEIKHALKNNKRLVPIVINEIKPDLVHNELSKRHWIIFNTIDKVFDEATKALIKAIKTDFEWIKEHTRIQKRALEWERNEKEAGYLLRGGDLKEAESWLSKAAGNEIQPTTLQVDYIRISREVIEEEQIKRTRALRRWITGLIVLVIIAVIAAIYAYVQQNAAVQSSKQLSTQVSIRSTAENNAILNEKEAIMQATVSRSKELASLSSASFNQYPERSLLLAVEANNNLKNHGVESDTIVMDTILDLTSKPIGYPINSERYYFTHNGKWLASYNEESIYLYQLDSRLPWEKPIEVPIKDIIDFMIPPKSDWLIVITENETYLWNLRVDSSNISKPIELGFGANECRKYRHTEYGIAMLTWFDDGTFQTYQFSGEKQIISKSEIIVPSWNKEDVVFSPSGDWALVPINSDTWKVWDISTNNLSDLISQSPFSSNSVVFPNGGSHMLYFDEDNSQIEVWNLKTTTLQETINLEYSFDYYFFSPNLEWLAVIFNPKNNVGLLDLRSLSEPNLSIYKTTGEFIQYIFGNNSDELLLFEKTLDEKCLVHSLNLNQENPWKDRNIYEHNSINDIGYANPISPSGKWMVTYKGTNYINLWDLSDLSKSPRVLSWSDNRYQYASLTDNWLLAVTENREIKLWNLDVEEPGIIIELSGHDFELYKIGLIASDHWFFTEDTTGTFRLWAIDDLFATDILNRNVLGTYPPFNGHNNWISSIVYTNQGYSLISAGLDGKLINWDLTDKSNLGKKEILVDDKEKVFNVKISNDGRWVAAVADSGSVYVYQLEDSQITNTYALTQNSADIHAVDFSENNNWLATGGSDGSLVLWELTSQGPSMDNRVYLCCHSSGFERGIYDIDFSPTNEVLALSDTSGFVFIWRIEEILTSKDPRPYMILDANSNSGSISPEFVVKFSNKGKWLATGGGDKRIALWDIDIADPFYYDLSTYEGEVTNLLGTVIQSGITSIRFSLDDSTLFASIGESIGTSVDNEIAVWNIDKLDEGPRMLRGADGNLITMDISPDGDWLVAGNYSNSSKGTALLWKTSDLDSPPVTLENHLGGVYSVTFSKDSKWLVTADLNLHLWSLDTEFLVERACELAGRNLTSIEWEQYFPGEEYRQTCQFAND